MPQKPIKDEDVDIEPDQFLADLPPSGRSEESGISASSSSLQPIPLAFSSISSEPQERRAQTPSASGGRCNNNNRAVKPQLVPFNKAVAAFGPGPALPRDDVVKHLPPKLVETLVDVVRTLDKIADSVAGFRPDQLGFLSDNVTRYVELLQQTDQAAAEYHADIPLQVLQMMDAEEDSNPELFTKMQLEKCHEESQQAAVKTETLEMLREALMTGLEELE
ncbi:unnamed protein product [Peronospora belbahrii]|uniref:Mediator of RNA polymerase II transcription subunit 10 n=1 Tax=Peronospora belbahrii TaxID=622444 RepID=A0AAU9L4F1_9STRA|nr:unnamed protein product [Peronospora belbahrii]